MSSSTVPWLREIQAHGQGGLKERLQARKKDRHQGDLTIQSLPVSQRATGRK